jgi:hypothetical protein
MNSRTFSIIRYFVLYTDQLLIVNRRADSNSIFLNRQILKKTNNALCSTQEL